MDADITSLSSCKISDLSAYEYLFNNITYGSVNVQIVQDGPAAVAVGQAVAARVHAGPPVPLRYDLHCRELCSARHCAQL